MHFLAKELFCLKSLMNLKKNLLCNSEVVYTCFSEISLVFCNYEMQTTTVKQSLKAEVLKILSINQTADSFVNATYQ